jgi:hypothetical protein
MRGRRDGGSEEGSARDGRTAGRTKSRRAKCKQACAVTGDAGPLGSLRSFLKKKARFSLSLRAFFLSLPNLSIPSAFLVPKKNCSREQGRAGRLFTGTLYPSLSPLFRKLTVTFVCFLRPIVLRSHLGLFVFPLTLSSLYQLHPYVDLFFSFFLYLSSLLSLLAPLPPAKI